MLACEGAVVSENNSFDFFNENYEHSLNGHEVRSGVGGVLHCCKFIISPEQRR